MFGLLKATPVTGKANTLVQVPSDQLFQFIGADLMENYPRWSPEVKELEKLSNGPISTGTKCRQVRVDQGNRSESTFQVTVFDSGKRICFEGISNPYRCDYLIESINEKNSRLTFVFELLDLEL